MEKLWAPWRMQYIASPKEEGCFLCRARESGDDKARHVLARGRGAFIIMNIFPYNNGHLLVATDAHVGNLSGVGPDVRLELMNLVDASIGALGKALSPQGYNVGINLGLVSGAGLAEHLHIHVVPRWNGDTNYMPILSETKVISEHINDTYKKLLPYFII